ncbi:ribbon-helix-helix domain-containing protein [Leptolyngbya sp. CCNP1308]|uniref:ribbon-helix-helix domain-containing protein n=1 Tax=Leptolyngbya sp. CCNP1308 TaxID=3110255 RepID=UPI003A59930B
MMDTNTISRTGKKERSGQPWPVRTGRSAGGLIVSARLRPDLYERFDVERKKLGCSKNDLIEMALEQLLQSH